MSDCWKEKYFAALEASEATDQALARLEALLRKAVNRLTLAVPSGDTELDAILGRMRGQVKKSPEPALLESLLDDVSQAISRLDNESKAGKLSRLPPWQLLERLLRCVPPSSGKEKHRRALLKALRRRDAGDQIEAHFETAIDVLSGASESVTPAPQAEPARLADPESSSILRSDELSHRCRDETPRVERQFLRLLDLLEINGQPATSLRQVLARGVAADQWEDTLQRIAKCVQETHQRRSRDRAEITRFLAQVTDRLRVIDQTLDVAAREQAVAHGHSQQLVSDVQQDMASLNDQARDALGLPDLQQLVEARTDGILNRLKKFQDEARQRQDEWSERMAALQEKVGALQVESDRLKQQRDQAQDAAQRDGLTGLPNRRSYDERLARAFDHWESTGEALSLVVCDIDHFKKLNDALGHQAGDKVLQSIACVIERESRGDSVVARYGGEEFVILLPGCSGDEAVTVAERVRSRVEASSFRFQGQPVNVTISCGATQFIPGDRPESAFERADQYLYQAKENGRNQVVGDPDTAAATPRSATG